VSARLADVIAVAPGFLHIQAGLLGRATPAQTGSVTVARLQADLDAAIAANVPAVVIASLRQRLAAAQAAAASSAIHGIGAATGYPASFPALDPTMAIPGMLQAQHLQKQAHHAHAHHAHHRNPYGAPIPHQVLQHGRNWPPVVR
jgi:hypothetical protein